MTKQKRHVVALTVALFGLIVSLQPRVGHLKTVDRPQAGKDWVQIWGGGGPGNAFILLTVDNKLRPQGSSHFVLHRTAPAGFTGAQSNLRQSFLL